MICCFWIIRPEADEGVRQHLTEVLRIPEALGPGGHVLGLGTRKATVVFHDGGPPGLKQPCSSGRGWLGARPFG
jgi:hypothetical protein